MFFKLENQVKLLFTRMDEGISQKALTTRILVKNARILSVAPFDPASQSRRPPGPNAHRLAELRAACEQHQGHAHAKTHALAVELLNDWDAIFQVLHHPELPLTHNVAERALRHWVIAR
jgi:hypothetical protein